MAIKTVKQKPPYYEKYRKPGTYKDSKDFVDGYNQALDDFDMLCGMVLRPDEKYRSATIHGGNQIHEICKEWRLERS